MQYTK